MAPNETTREHASDEAPVDPVLDDDIEGRAAGEEALRIAAGGSQATVSFKDEAEFNDFRNFVFALWAELGLPNPTRVQYEIARFLQHGPRRRMVLAFRGVAKTWLTGAYVLWRLKRNPMLQVLVVSASADHAASVTHFIFKCILEVPWLRHLTPDERKGHKVSTRNFDVNGCKISVQPSVRARGITGQLPGNRADLIIADDVEVPKNSDTVTKREAIHRGLAEFASILKPGGEIIFLGTYQSEESVYKDLPAKGYRLFTVPARYPDETQVKIYGDTLAAFILDDLERKKVRAGEPTDPERFHDEDLLERELEFGRSTFALQFMLLPVLVSDLHYPLRLRDLVVVPITATHGPRTVVWGGGSEFNIPPDDLPNVGFRSDTWKRAAMYSKDLWDPWHDIHMFIDPSGRGQDEVAYAITGHLGGKIAALDVGGMMGGYEDDNLEALADKALEFKVSVVTLEENFGGGMFTKLFRAVLERRAKARKTDPPRIEEVHSVGQKEKRIIDTLEPLMNQHRLMVSEELVGRDYESTANRSSEKLHVYRLFYQMTHLTKERDCLKHDDRIESLAGSCAYWTTRIAEDEDEHRKEMEFDEAVAKLESIGIKGPPTTNWTGNYAPKGDFH